MQPMSTPPKAGKVAFQYGLIFGVIQALVASGVLLINDFVATGQIGVSLILSGLGFLVGLAAYFVAGILAARQTGKVSTGTFAGMWTGAIYGVIGLVVSMILFFQVSLPKVLDAVNNANATASPDTLRTAAIFGGVFAAVFGVLFAIGLGAGLGALGGLIGKNISKVQPAPAELAYPTYPAQPYPGQPYSAQADPSQPNPYAQPNMEQPGSQPYREQ